MTLTPRTPCLAPPPITAFLFRPTTQPVLDRRLLCRILTPSPGLRSTSPDPGRSHPRQRHVPAPERSSSVCPRPRAARGPHARPCPVGRGPSPSQGPAGAVRRRLEVSHPRSPPKARGPVRRPAGLGSALTGAGLGLAACGRARGGTAATPPGETPAREAS